MFGHKKTGERVTIDVTPKWWRSIHHKPDGAFPIALPIALKGLTVYELHATEGELTLVVPAGVKADAIRERLETEIAIEPSDRLPNAPADSKRMDRKALEVTLTEMGMHPTDGAPHVWTAGGLSVYVELTKDGSDDDVARVETNDGEGQRWHTYTGVLDVLEEFAQEAGKITDADLADHVDSLGSAPGGVLRNRW